MSRIPTREIIASIVLATTATAACAHAQLQKAAVPTAKSAATEIRLKFSEDLEPRFSEIALETLGTVPEALRPASVDPIDNSVVIVRLRRALGPGIYKVTWHTVSVDSHRTEGSFAFIVAP